MAYYVTNENSFLDIKNAHLRVTGNVHTDVLKVGSIGFQPAGSNISGTVNFTNVTTGVTTSSNLDVGGTLNLGTVELSASTHTLDHITARGNVTSTTVQFDNATTGLVTTANVEVGGELTVSGNATVSENLTVSSNIEVAGFVGTSGTGALTVPSGTSTQQPSTGLVSGMLRFNTELSDLEYYTSPESSSPVVTGGTIDTITGGDNPTDTQVRYKIHTFTTGGVDLTVTTGPVLIEYLIIGGGGGGGADHGGGGGGGGYVTGTMKLLNGTYPIVIGSGGTRGVGTASGGVYVFATNGGNSSAFGLTAYGGGYGGSRNYQSSGVSYGSPTLGGHGANGGGGAGTGYIVNDTKTQGGMNKIYSNEWKPILNDHSIQGNVGGYGTSETGANAGNGGGGGGAGGGGQNSTGSGSGAGKPGNGGVGKFSGITGNWVERAGGGGGGRWSSGSMSSASGGGGIGGGLNSNGEYAASGTPNTGGGGGGGPDGGGHGAGGGSGIVIVRYKV